MLKGITIIFVFLFIGEFISKSLNIPIPGNVIGMILITAALRFNIIKLESVKQTSDILIKNMILFFIPPAVGIMLYFDMIKNDWLTLLVGLFPPTFIVLFVVAKLQQRLEND
jgi:holin-like protein